MARHVRAGDVVLALAWAGLVLEAVLGKMPAGNVRNPPGAARPGSRPGPTAALRARWHDGRERTIVSTVRGRAAGDLRSPALDGAGAL